MRRAGLVSTVGDFYAFANALETVSDSETHRRGFHPPSRHTIADMETDPAADVAAGYRRLGELGLIAGSAGNVSVRAGDTMWITPSNVPAPDVTAETICTFDLRSGQTGGPRPSSEWMFHVRTYAATDATAIVHTHSLAATAVTLVADELPAVHYYVVRLGGPVPVAPYFTYGSEELAGSVAGALRDGRSAVLLQNHGAVVTGDTLAEAIDRAELLEWLSDLYLRAAAIRPPRTLDAEQLDAVTKQADVVAARGYRCC
jgi:L-fuculose-phosphate aldolase